MQEELNFEAGARNDGLSAWRAGRKAHLRDLARANGIPLGHPCLVNLVGGVVLEGPLMLAEETLLPPDIRRDLNLQVQIQRCVFTPREIVSLVRLD